MGQIAAEVPQSAHLHGLSKTARVSMLRSRLLSLVGKTLEIDVCKCRENSRMMNLTPQRVAAVTKTWPTSRK